MSAWKRRKQELNMLKEDARRIRREKRERILKILLNNKEKGLPGTNIIGYKLDEQNNLIKI